MLTLIQHIDVYGPDRLGKKDILVADRRIVAVADHIDLPDISGILYRVDGSGLIAVPGLIDNHVHITGGGGEGGFATRTPELEISDLVRAGVTSVIGVRGTDGVTRSMENLVAKAKAIRALGFSCWVLTGSYQVPVRTLTDRIESDIMLIQEIIGVGEIAIADHRSSHPRIAELMSLVSAARTGGMLAGKSGVVNFHLGSGEGGFDILETLRDQGEFPVRHLFPTHVNRSVPILKKGFNWARHGGVIDLTASGFVPGKDDPRTKCSRALKLALEDGVGPDRISFSSDGQGSLPEFNARGEICGMAVGSCASLLNEVRDAVHAENLPLETALRPVTETPARIFGLSGKGRIETGYDADLVLLNTDLSVCRVMSQGRFFDPEADG